MRKRAEIYLDCEWFLNSKMYLIGYAYSENEFGQLYGRRLTSKNVAKLFDGVKRIYFWGPDIGYLEKCFGLELKGKYVCVNLLTAMRQLEPRRHSYKLAHFEKLAGLKRTTTEYKANIFYLHQDWFNPRKRQRALLYNKEDVIFMLKVKEFFFAKHAVKVKDLEKWRLKV